MVEFVAGYRSDLGVAHGLVSACDVEGVRSRPQRACEVLSSRPALLFSILQRSSPDSVMLTRMDKGVHGRTLLVTRCLAFDGNCCTARFASRRRFAVDLRVDIQLSRDTTLDVVRTISGS